MSQPIQHQRPTDAANRFRLYIDESGDHVFNRLDQPAHRFLCLLGCWFRNADYVPFHEALETFKRLVLPHHPDEPLVLHREDIVNQRGPFGRLQDSGLHQRFDEALLLMVQQAEFRIVAVVIDKLALRDRYGAAAAHPYHLAMGSLLQRYCGYLNHINRVGDVMAESRGGREDRLLKDSYQRHYEQGAWTTPASQFQSALTSRELKLKPKSANIAGLQLADLLGHPVKHAILHEHGLFPGETAPYAFRLLEAIAGKFNSHLYDERIEGYGKVLFPK
jgi:hypothetical protein